MARIGVDVHARLPHQADEDVLQRALAGLQVLEVDARLAEPAQQRRRCRCARPGRRRCRPARCRRPTAPADQSASAAGMACQRALQVQGQLLLAELLHQRGLLLDQDQLALVDHADAVGHLLGLLDVVGGQDDGDAAGRAARAPSPTCRGAARRRRRRWARRGTGSAARGDSALAIITRRFMPPDSVMILAVLLVPQRQVAQHLLDVGRVRRACRTGRG